MKKSMVGLCVACCVLILGMIGLAVGWGITATQAKAENKELSQNVENIYRRNYYEFTYELSNSGDTLNKLTVTSSKSMQQKLLTKLSEEMSAAVVCLSTIADTSNGENTIAFLNKVGDYAKSLNYKLSLGNPLDQNDKNNIASIYAIIIELNKSLESLGDKVEDNYNFLEYLNSKDDVMSTFLTNAEVDVKYPSLIYDGPFSDALEEKTPCLSGQEIDQNKAREMAKSYLPFSAEPTFTTESSGDVPSYIFTAKDGYNNDYFITIAKNGGWLVSITSNITADDNVFDDTTAEKVASDYLAFIGITDMEAVWVSDYNSIYYINFVYKCADIIYYPDMIKVKVSAKDKSIVGVECLNYIYNHKERDSQIANLTAEQASEKVENIQIEGVRLAIIPRDGGKEKLCYEVAGKTNEDYYFVYIDCESGDEVEILRVVDSAQGKLLL